MDPEQSAGDCQIADDRCLRVLWTSVPTAKQERAAIASQSSGNLNLRDGPGVQYPILAKIPAGASLTALNSVGSWYIVDFNGLIGFASDAYVSVF